MGMYHLPSLNAKANTCPEHLLTHPPPIDSKATRLLRALKRTIHITKTRITATMALRKAHQTGAVVAGTVEANLINKGRQIADFLVNIHPHTRTEAAEAIMTSSGAVTNEVVKVPIILTTPTLPEHRQHTPNILPHGSQQSIRSTRGNPKSCRKAQPFKLWRVGTKSNQKMASSVSHSKQSRPPQLQPEQIRI
jgi:hypothetical protein